MKKILLTSLLAFFAVSSVQAADLFVGGGASFNTNEAHANYIGVSPEIGWKYNDNLDLGFGVSLNYSRIDADNGNYFYGANMFSRYKIAQFGDFKLLLRGGLNASFITRVSDDETLDGETSTMLGLSIAPMITYDISESFTLYANLNFLGVSASYQFENEKIGMTEYWRIDAFTDSADVFNTGYFQIGFLYNF